MPTRIFLCRHGGTIWSNEERFAGSSDIPLSDEGRAQAAALGKRLAGETIDAAYCSTLQRTMDTAKLALGSRSIAPQPMAGLREVDHGHWEGMRPIDVQQQLPGEYAAWDADPFMAPPPGGESGLAVLARALPAMRTIVASHPDQTVLVVSHKATNRLMLCSFMGIDLRYYRERITQELACLNVVVFTAPSSARVALMDDVSHYRNLPR